MNDDASLNDFLGSDAEGDEEGSTADATDTEADNGTAASSGDEGAETEAVDATDGPAPAATTYAWDGDGAACGACGEVVERRWQQDGGLVCVACKEW
jgi:hypothetical protein